MLNKDKYYRLRLKTEIGQKRFEKAKRRESNFSSYGFVSSNSHFRTVGFRYRGTLLRYLEKQLSCNELEAKAELKVPESLSFVDYPDETIQFVHDLANSLLNCSSHTIINFEKCKKLSISAVTIMQIIVQEFFKFRDDFNQNNFIKTAKRVRIKQSKIIDVNMMLQANEIINEIWVDDDNEEEQQKIDDRYMTLGLLTGSRLRVSPREDKKGIISREVSQFVDESIQEFGFKLGAQGQNYLINLVGEILGNAEDHSAHSNYFVNGVAFRRERKDSDLEVELNLSIINFGYSIFDGLVQMAKKNRKQQHQIDNLFEIHQQKMKSQNRKDLSKESLYTLYALQQGVSRLKYEDDGRGNGTMNFIRNFIRLGVAKNENSQSNLSVISGHSIVQCNNDYEPYPKPGSTMYELSLNKRKELASLPDKGMVKHISMKFPGTILQVKVLMNQQNFEILYKEKETKTIDNA